MGLKAQITEDMKTAMRAKEAGRLATIRLILAEIKRKEVDEQIEVSDAQTVAIVEKMIKQRKDSITQFEAGGRADLADIEKAELAVLAPTCRPACRTRKSPLKWLPPWPPRAPPVRRTWARSWASSSRSWLAVPT
jgi:hypothetical protein